MGGIEMTTCRECGCDSDMRDHCDHMDIDWDDPRNNGDPMCTDCYHVFTKKEDQSWLFQRMFQ